LLPQCALRSLVLGGIVWLLLRALRLRDLQLRMTAWTVVLIASPRGLPRFGHN
jgi:hypothetical protein